MMILVSDHVNSPYLVTSNTKYELAGRRYVFNILQYTIKAVMAYDIYLIVNMLRVSL